MWLNDVRLIFENERERNQSLLMTSRNIWQNQQIRNVPACGHSFTRILQPHQRKKSGAVLHWPEKSHQIIIHYAMVQEIGIFWIAPPRSVLSPSWIYFFQMPSSWSNSSLDWWFDSWSPKTKKSKGKRVPSFTRGDFSGHSIRKSASTVVVTNYWTCECDLPHNVVYVKQ